MAATTVGGGVEEDMMEFESRAPRVTSFSNPAKELQATKLVLGVTYEKEIELEDQSMEGLVVRRNGIPRIGGQSTSNMVNWRHYAKGPKSTET